MNKARRRSRRLDKAPLQLVQRQLQALIQDWLEQDAEEQSWQLSQWERRLQQASDQELKMLHRGLVEWIDALEKLPALPETENKRYAMLLEMYYAINRVRDPRRVQATQAARGTHAH